MQQNYNMLKQNLSDEFIISEAVRLVEEGKNVIFKVNGTSMLPFIIGGKESVVFSKVDNPQKFDVVLAYTTLNQYVVHRIIDIDGQKITLMGDGNLKGKEYCKVSDIKAEVHYVVDSKGKKHRLDNPLRLFLARIWFLLLPLRSYLLRIYKKINRI